MEQVHAAWLEAGVKGDVQAMRSLRAQHPQWLDLNRLVLDRSAADTAAPAQRRFCSWEAFHLSTIGASALHTAAWEGSEAIVELLLEAGQDPDTRDDSGLTPIMVTLMRYNIIVTRCVFRDGQAVRRNLVVDCRHEESEMLRHVIAVIQLLLAFGADANARGQDGCSALHYVANSDALELAELLVDAGADINTQDNDGKTPLHQCIHEGSLLVANLLVSRGAHIDLKDVHAVTALMFVLQCRNVNMLQIMLNQHHLVATAERRDFAADVLMRAVECEFEEAVRLIVEGRYAVVTTSNSARETPLHRAILKRSSQLMELLIELDPDGNTLTATTLADESPAHYAARYGTVHQMEVLLRHITLRFGNLAALEEGANPLNAINGEGATCLYLVGTSRSCTGSQEEERNAVVRLLLEHCARLFLRDSVVVRSGSGPTERLRLHDQVHRGVALWVRESSDRNNEIADEDDADDRIEARNSNTLLTELCVEWVASLTAVPSTAVGEHQSYGADLAAVLHIAISSGYALEFIPLLLELPLLRSAMPALLHRLERFSRFPRPHPLLFQLYMELSEALTEIVES